MKIQHAILLIAFIFAQSLPASSDHEDAPQDRRLKDLYSEIQQLAMRYYPEATFHFIGTNIHFESDTRTYIIHVPLKTGEWQDPRAVRGPKKGGILGTIELRDGRYGGAAAVPQNFDRHYYEVMLMASYSKKYDCHLLTKLYVPRLKKNDAFIKEFTELINNFEKKIKE